MGTMITGSESMYRFCDELLETVDQLQEQLKNTERAMDEVATDWKDAQFKEFHKQFGEDKDKINPLCKKLEDYESDILRPLADIVKEYEEQTFNM